MDSSRAFDLLQCPIHDRLPQFGELGLEPIDKPGHHRQFLLYLMSKTLAFLDPHGQRCFDRLSITARRAVVSSSSSRVSWLATETSPGTASTSPSATVEEMPSGMSNRSQLLEDAGDLVGIDGHRRTAGFGLLQIQLAGHTPPV